MLPASHPLLRRRDDKQYVFASETEKPFTKKIPAIPAGTRSVDLSDRRKTSAFRQILWSECNFGTRQQPRRKQQQQQKKAFYIVLADSESSRDVREPLLKLCKVWLGKTMETCSIDLLLVFILFASFSRETFRWLRCRIWEISIILYLYTVWLI